MDNRGLDNSQPFNKKWEKFCRHNLVEGKSWTQKVVPIHPSTNWGSLHNQEIKERLVGKTDQSEIEPRQRIKRDKSYVLEIEPRQIIKRAKSHVY